jgi:hypothetical protein
MFSTSAPRTASVRDFHSQIPVAEYETQIPWLISENELYNYIPRDEFTFSSTGWPMLQFTILGITSVFGKRNYQRVS